MEITQLADDIWLQTSYKPLPNIGLFQTNSLIVRTSRGIFLIDTAWNDEQTREIQEWTRATLSSPIKFAVVTHAHDDKMGGVGALHQMGVATYALKQTNEAAPGRGLVAAKYNLAFKDGIEAFADGEIEAFYPGPGHTADNIVIYLKGAKVLYGGCLIRSEESHSLGNTTDADVGHWDVAVANVKARYSSARIVVPSHGPPGGFDLLDHTVSVVVKSRSKADKG